MRHTQRLNYKGKCFAFYNATLIIFTCLFLVLAFGIISTLNKSEIQDPMSIAGLNTQFQMENADIVRCQSDDSSISKFSITPKLGQDPIRTISISIYGENSAAQKIFTLAVTDEFPSVVSDDNSCTYELGIDGVGYLTINNLSVQTIAEAGNFQALGILGTAITKVVNITYNLDSGSVASSNPASATYGAHAPTIVNIPTKANYDFYGFYTAPNGRGTLVYNAQGASNRIWDLENDVTLYAYWVGKTYTILLNNGSATTAGTPFVEAIYGEPMPTIISPSRAARNFQGYYDSTGNVKYYNVDGTSAHICDFSSNATLFASWSGAVNYSITYNGLTGATVSPVNPTVYNYDTNTFTLTNPTKEGYTFVGWSGTDLYGDNNTNVTVNQHSEGDRTYTAHWSIAEYSISYTLDGGSVVSPNPTTYTMETATFTLNNPTRTGYNFAGWTGTDLASATTTVTISVGSTGNRSYTATWTPTNYTISYTLNDGTVASPNPTSYNITTATFTLNNPTRSGFLFLGWSGTGLTGDENTTVTITKGSTGNRSYTANWSASIIYSYDSTNYTVGFNVDGGVYTDWNDVVADSSKGLGGLLNILPTPQKTDYYFAGWFNGSTRYSASSSVQNITLTAKWVPSTGANASAKYILFNTTTDSSGTPKSTLSSAVSDSVSDVSNVILVCDDDSLSTSVTIPGKDITIRSASAIKTINCVGAFLYSSSSGKITLENITAVGSGSGDSISISNNSSYSGNEININSGTTITNFYRTSTGGGAGVKISSGVCTMTGGIISNNWSTYGGGGVYVGSDGTFIMNGGIITGNTAGSTSGGGGVYVSDCSFVMNGGIICNNTANQHGGGVYITGWDGEMTMNGGIICNNTAKYYSGSVSGGGVYIYRGIFKLSSGVIFNNKSTGSSASLLNPDINATIYDSTGDTAILSSGMNDYKGFVMLDSKFMLIKAQNDAIFNDELTVTLNNNPTLLPSITGNIIGNIPWVATDSSTTPITTVSAVTTQENSQYVAYLYDARPSVTITLNPGANGTVSPSSISGKKTFDKYGELPVPTNSNGDLVFVGWNTDSNGDGNYIGSALDIVETISHTLYAVWADTTDFPVGNYIVYSYGVDGAPYSTLSGAVDACVNVGTIFLNANTTESIATIIEGKDITLRSAGDYAINQGAVTINNSFIRLNSDAIFTMHDVTLNGKNSSTYTSRGIYVNSGIFNLYSGTIKNFYTASNTDGGGVWSDSGYKNAFNMYGGSIINNTATGNGGGVYGKINMYGGTISNNNANSGGGIYVYGASTINDGTISGNVATSYGGGIYVNSATTINGGIISGNRANYGAGVYVYNTFNMAGGIICGNIATNNGGGVFIVNNKTFTMTDGIISNNSASSGGGVYVSSGTFSLTKGVVFGNKASGNVSDQYSNVYGDVSSPSSLSGGTTGYQGFMRLNSKFMLIKAQSDSIFSDTLTIALNDDPTLLPTITGNTLGSISWVATDVSTTPITAVSDVTTQENNKYVAYLYSA